jgi:hypothetical protein
MAALLACTGQPGYGLLTLTYDGLLAVALWNCWRCTRSPWVAISAVPFLLHLGQSLEMLGPPGRLALPTIPSWPLLLSVPLVAFFLGNGMARSLGSKPLAWVSWAHFLAIPFILDQPAQNVFAEMRWYWGLFGLQGLILFRARPLNAPEHHLGLSPSQGEPGLAC